jgi:RHS repeat-associated protein
MPSPMNKFPFSLLGWLTAFLVGTLAAQAQSTAVTVKIGATITAITGSSYGISVSGSCLPTPDNPGGGFGGGSSTNGLSGPLSWFVTAQVIPDKDYVMSYSAYAQNGAPTGSSSGSISVAAPPGFQVQINQRTAPAYGWYYSYSPGTQPQSGNFTYRVVSMLSANGERAGAATSITSGQVRWQVALGSLKNGNPAGSIVISDPATGIGSTPWSALFTSAALQYLSPSAEIVAYSDASGNLRQILANQAYIDIVTVSSTSYRIDFYAPCSLTGQNYTPSTPYVFSGSPYVSYLIRQGGTATTFQVLESIRNLTTSTLRYQITTLARTGTALNNFQWILDDWNDCDSTGAITAGQQLREEKRVWGGTATNLTETMTRYKPTQSADLTVNNAYQQFNWGMQLVSSTLGGSNPTPANIFNPITTGTTTSATYGLLQSTVSATGSWAGYDYFSSGADSRSYWTVSHIYRPFGNQSLPGTFSTTQGEVSTYQYTYDGFGAPTRPTSIVTQVNGTTTAKSVFGYVAGTAPAPDSQATISMTKSDSFDNSSAVLTTTSNYYSEVVTDDFFTSKTRSATQPDGVQVSYAYQRGTYNPGQTGQAAFTASANNTVNTSSTGSSYAEIIGTSHPGGTLCSSYNNFPLDPLYLIDGKSTLQVTLRDSQALVRQVQSYVWLSGAWVLTANSVNTFDSSGLLTSTIAINGATISSTYDGDRATAVTNISGVTVNYTYDKAGQLFTEVKTSGPLTTYAYNAAGNVLSKTVSDGGTDAAIVDSMAYDDAGRITSETPAGLSSISYAYFYGATAASTTGVSNATYARKATFADTGYKYDIQQIDGRPLALTGTAMVEQDYSYALDATNSGFLDTIVHAGGTSSARWTTAVSDWLGRPVRTTRPGFTGQSNYVVTNLYDTTTGGTGHLLETDRTGQAPTKYQYDVLGTVTRSGMDLGNNNLLLGSHDIIADTNQVVELYTPPGGTAGYWLRQDSIVYPTLDNSTPLTASTTRKRLTGFPANRFEETRTTDAYGNTVVQTTDVNTGTKTITSTTTLPGVTNPLVETMVNGLKTTMVGVDGLTTTYGYDGLERPKSVTDTRGNTTTSAYIAGANLVSTVTDATSTVVSTSTYDALGRPKSNTNAGGYLTYFGYNLRGQLIQQWGNATYPVSRGYDPTYGDCISMTTYRLSPGSSPFTGTIWPTTPPSGDTTAWAYDGPSGLLASKTDAGTTPGVVSYTYNQIGQVATRLWARKLSDNITPVTTTYNYDLVSGTNTGTGRLTSVAYNDGTHGVSYAYMRTGQMQSVSDATATRNFNYNNASQPLELTNVTLDSVYYNGRVLTQKYNTDNLLPGRPTGFQLGTSVNPSADLTQTYQFNNKGYYSSLSTISQGGSNSVTFNYGYLSNACLVQSIGVSGNASYTVTRGYDPKRNLLTSIINTGSTGTVTQFNYTYNSLGQRVYSTQQGTAYADYWSGTTYGSVYNAQTYDSYGQLVSRTMFRNTPPGTGSPSPSDQIPGHNYILGFDTIGNRTSSGETGTVADDTYTANSLNQYQGRTNETVRITGNANASATITTNLAFPAASSVAKLDRNFAFDVFPSNNLSGPAQGSVAVTATISGSAGNTVNRDYFVPPASQSFTYDADGNLTFDGVWNYGYDAENRLIAMTSALGAGFTNSGLTLSFAYDYLNRRVEKRVFNASGTTFQHRYIYDGWNLVAETDQLNTGRIFRSYSWGLDLTGSLTSSGGVGALLEITNFNYSGTNLSSTINYFPQYDGNGNLSDLVHGDGSLAAAYEYGPFGEAVRNEVFDTAIADQSFKFSTKYTDAESGLVYFGNRFYSPTLGRFINRDCIAEAGGLNLYGFCGNDAINRFDVNGNSWLSKLWDHTVLSLGKHIAQNWDHGRRYVVAVAAIVAAAVTWGALSPLATAAIAAEFGVAATSTLAVVGGGMIAGAAAGFVGGALGTALSGGNLGQVMSSGLHGALAGAIVGGVDGYFGNSFTIGRVVATATASGVASTISGGSFTKGFEIGGALSLVAYGWGRMRDFTDEAGQNAAANDATQDRYNYDATGSLRTDGTINAEDAPSAFGSTIDRITAPITRFLDSGGMGPQGVVDAHWYDSAPTWLGGGMNGGIATFINAVSKVHDFWEGWDYNVGAGSWISRGSTFNGLYDIYGMIGMPPSGIYAAAALNPSTAYIVQQKH